MTPLWICLNYICRFFLLFSDIQIYEFNEKNIETIRTIIQSEMRFSCVDFGARQDEFENARHLRYVRIHSL